MKRSVYISHLIILSSFLSACIIFPPLPKDYPHNNFIGGNIEGMLTTFSGRIEGKPDAEQEKMLRIYNKIEEILAQSTKNKKKIYRDLENIGMYCMYFNNSKEIECRYKIYLKHIGDIREGVNPLLLISVFPDKGIGSIVFDATNYGINLSREESYSIMLMDKKNGVSYE